MRVLVGWNDEAEAETISLILTVEETIVEICTDAEQFEKCANERDYEKGFERRPVSARNRVHIGDGTQVHL